MLGLFLRTLSQGLQALVPVAAAWTWSRRYHPPLATSIRNGLLLAVIVSGGAAWAFGQNARKALTEAVLAGAALVITAAFFALIRNQREPAANASHQPAAGGIAAPTSTAGWVVLATVLIVVRQTMEIGSVLGTAIFGLHSLDAAQAVLAGLLIATLVAAAWAWIGKKAAGERLQRATIVFTGVFALQVLIYCLHESAEAHLLPWSDVLHEASEPYGPDGVYGIHLSELLVILPLVAALFVPARRAVRTALVIAVCGLGLPPMLRVGGGVSTVVAAAADDVPGLTRQPHVVFRDTTQGAAFSLVSVAPLDAPERTRATTDLACERVAFGGGRGICLHAEKSFFGLFSGYTALLLGPDFKPQGTPIKLDGKPSRARVSTDGKLGAFTVFVLGDGYDTNFSTRTTIVDMRTGAPLADLENFSTFRNGERFSAKDFNFWGVTFAHDGNTFYASLRTNGMTYLVRGDLAARRFTVVRENVECPSISPDDRFVAFKKFIGPDPGAWRIAVLELATMKERLVSGETRYIDDQVEWLDGDRLLYAITRRTTSIADVWVASATGDAPAKVYLPQAESPTIIR